MNLADFHFIRPYWLLTLIPAVILTVLMVRHKLNQGNWSKVCDVELLPFILQQKATQKKQWALSVTAFSALLTIIALAGPTWERLPAPVFRNDAALVIALDLSRSMDASDIKPSRLSRARFKIADILKQRKDGQTALLVYAGDAFVVTPLTEDTETITSQLSALKTEIMPSQGSNTPLALQKAVELLKQSGLQTGEILLVTDGVDYEHTIDSVESLAAYKLSILGVGTTEGAPIKAFNGGFVKDRQGNIVVPKLNTAELSRLSHKGDGLYQTITADDSDIEALIAHIDTPNENAGEKDNSLFIDQWDEKGPWLLLLVLPFAALNFRKGLLSFALLILLPFPQNSYALEWNDLWQTQDQKAQQAFDQNNYQQAAEQFDTPQWKAASQYKAKQYEQAVETLTNDESARGLYNKGNALAQSGKLKEALKAYDESLQKDASNDDAKYNKQQVEKALEKQKQDQKPGDDQQQSDQEKSEKNDQQKGDQQQEQQGDKAEQSEDQNDSESSEQQDKEKADSEEPEDAEYPPEQEQEEADAKEENAQQATEEPSEYDESEQASEQWLKRIPDDPAGLLKRKFKYQYGQRGRKNTNTQAW